MEEKIKVINELGLHARAAMKLVQEANKFKSSINVVKDGAKVNAKSIMGILSLAAVTGTELIITAEGEDEKEALTTLKNLFLNKFGEGK